VKGVGRNHKNEGKKKGGLKVHMMIDAHSQTPKFVKISEARQHYKNFFVDSTIKCNFMQSYHKKVF